MSDRRLGGFENVWQGFRVGGADDCQGPGKLGTACCCQQPPRRDGFQVQRGVTKMELLLRREWLTLRHMDDGVGNIEVWRARPEEADAASVWFKSISKWLA